MTQRTLRFDRGVAERWGIQPVEQIAAEVGCSIATVYIAARRSGVFTGQRAKGHRWTLAEDRLLRELFSTETPIELERRFGLGYEQIRTRAKRLRLRSRRATAVSRIHHDFFERDSVEAAYFAGLLAADGWVAARNEICLALKVTDRAMVDRFAETVNSSREVRVYRQQARASVTSARMVAALDERWNIHRAKTYDLEPPRIDDPTLQLAYAAGHLDGDGFVVGPGRAKVGAVLRCGAIGTEPVIRWIADVLNAVSALAGGSREVRFARLADDKYSFPMFEWRTSDHNAVIVLDAMRAVIGDLGIQRKWATHEKYRAVLAARQMKKAA